MVNDDVFCAVNIRALVSHNTHRQDKGVLKATASQAARHDSALQMTQTAPHTRFYSMGCFNSHHSRKKKPTSLGFDMTW